MDGKSTAAGRRALFVIVSLIVWAEVFPGSTLGLAAMRDGRDARVAGSGFSAAVGGVGWNTLSPFVRLARPFVLPCSPRLAIPRQYSYSLYHTAGKHDPVVVFKPRPNAGMYAACRHRLGDKSPCDNRKYRSFAWHKHFRR